MKYILYVVLIFIGLQSNCFAGEEEIPIENGAAAPILFDVVGGHVYHDDALMKPRRNQVYTENAESALSVFGTLSQPDDTLLHISCGSLSGKGRIEGENIDVRTGIWDFYGTLFCENVCTIRTTSDIGGTILPHTNFTGGGRVVIRKIDENGNQIGFHEFNANPFIIPNN